MPEVTWNAHLYDDKHAFVSKYGEDLLGWLAPQKGERILDLGCGTGQLASSIAESGALVMGMDHSGEMIRKARSAYPHIPFEVMDARNFSCGEPFDAIFSNAALHWINEQEPVIACMHRALRPGGRLVLEMGGKGNVQAIVEAVGQAVSESGCSERISPAGWFFPSPAEYSTLLEAGGFEVRTVLYFDRETPLEGENGMENWIRMFGGFFLQGLETKEADRIIERAVALLRPGNYRNGSWYGDYRRLRIKAVKK
jgi:trans-aconitate methyltransferase